MYERARKVIVEELPELNFEPGIKASETYGKDALTGDAFPEHEYIDAFTPGPIDSWLSYLSDDLTALGVKGTDPLDFIQCLEPRLISGTQALNDLGCAYCQPQVLLVKKLGYIWILLRRIR